MVHFWFAKCNIASEIPLQSKRLGFRSFSCIGNGVVWVAMLSQTLIVLEAQAVRFMLAIALRHFAEPESARERERHERIIHQRWRYCLRNSLAGRNVRVASVQRQFSVKQESPSFRAGSSQKIARTDFGYGRVASASAGGCRSRRQYRIGCCKGSAHGRSLRRDRRV